MKTSDDVADSTPRFRSRYGPFEIVLIAGQSVAYFDDDQYESDLYSMQYGNAQIDGSYSGVEPLSGDGYVIVVHTEGGKPRWIPISCVTRIADTDEYAVSESFCLAPGGYKVLALATALLVFPVLGGHWVVGACLALGVGIAGYIKLRRLAIQVCAEAARFARFHAKTRRTMSGKVSPRKPAAYVVTEHDLQQSVDAHTNSV